MRCVGFRECTQRAKSSEWRACDRCDWSVSHQFRGVGSTGAGSDEQVPLAALTRSGPVYTPYGISRSECKRSTSTTRGLARKKGRLIMQGSDHGEQTEDCTQRAGSRVRGSRPRF